MKTKPWQIVALSTLCFIQAVHLISVVASKVAVKSNPAAVEAQAELGLASGGGASDVEAVYEHLGTSQFVWSLLAVVTFMFGFLLYRGEFLLAIRITGSIFFAVGIVGQIGVAIPRATAIDTVLDETTAQLLTLGLTALLFAGFISLFFGKSAQWVKEHPEST